MQTRNKLNDFKVLSKASEALQEKLRGDDSNPDLINQFSDTVGCHKYYIEPYREEGSLVEKADFFPFPKRIIEQYSHIECASFMGILPEIDRVWITIDNRLYLWSYVNQHEFEMYDGLSEVIVSVALCAPKPNVFLETVKYVLVVATSVEVVVLAITATADDGVDKLKLVPTAYALPSDNITMFKIIGSQKGRIFMAGNDGNLYELDYSNADNSWASQLGMSAPTSHKCRKINHFAFNWQLKHLIPPFLRTPIFGDDDSLFDVTVDDMRNVLYCVTTKGILSAVFLGATGQSAAFVSRSFDILEQAKAFLERGRYCESSPRAESFSSSAFTPGFNIVGIFVVSLTESKKVHLVIVLGNGIRIYLSLYTELGGFYSRVPQETPATDLGNGDGLLAYPGIDRNADPPTRVEISYVLSPPPRIAIQHSVHSASNSVTSLPAEVQDMAANGCRPSFDRVHSLEIGMALYSKGVVLLASEPRDPSAPPGDVLGLYEDVVLRSRSGAGMGGNAAAGDMNVPGYMREGLSTVLKSDHVGNKVYDMKERCTTVMRLDSASQVTSLFFQSLTPGDTHLKDSSFHKHAPMLKRKADSGIDAIPPSEFPVTLSGSNCLAPAGRKRGLGYAEHDLDSVVPLNEFCHQHIPSGNVSLQRQFLVLTNQGVHLLRKIRPIDILHRDLMLADQHVDRLRIFFSRSGAVQASSMCVALACGLPSDAGTGLLGRGVTGLPGLEPMLSGGVGMGNVISANTLQSRAMSAVLSLTSGPSYKTVGDISNLARSGESAAAAPAAGGAQSLVDSRLVLSGGGAPEYIRSTVHDALYITASRILRAIWLRGITTSVSDGTKELLDSMWSRELLTEISHPLHRLADIIKGYFPMAVQADISAGQLQDFNVSTSSPSLVSNNVTGGAAAAAGYGMIVQRPIVGAAITRAEQDARRILEQQARVQEELSLSILYRLITRALHTLALLDILIGVRDDWCIPIAWSQLKNISFRALVISLGAHNKVKKVLNSLINQLSSSDKLSVSERLIERLSTEAFHFFSAGDRFEYEATRELDRMQQDIEMRAGGSGTTGKKFYGDLQLRQSNIVGLLLRAAKYWKSLEAVIQGSSSERSTALTSTCFTLMQLGEHGRNGIVDICLIVAENFLGPMGLVVDVKSPATGIKDLSLRLTNAVSDNSSEYDHETNGADFSTREQHLYHGGGIVAPPESHLAIDACCRCLVDNIMAVGAGKSMHSTGIGEGVTGTGQSLYDQYVTPESMAAGEDPVRSRAQAHMHAMIVRCVTYCEGRGSTGNGALIAMADMFLEKLFTRLLNEQQEQLLAVRSQSVAAFLKEKDTDLLYSYFERHSEFVQASTLMSELARDDKDTEIQERIQCFIRAIASGERVLTTMAQGPRAIGGEKGSNSSDIMSTLLTMNPPSAGVFSEYLLELKDLLEIATYQQSAFTQLAGDYQYSKEELARVGGGSTASEASLESLERTVRSLRFKLIDITQLFGVVCLPYKLWDICLKLLHVSNSEDPDLTERLWCSIIYKIVPEEGRSVECRQFLRCQRTPMRMEFDKRYQAGGYFEDSDMWLPTLGNSVVQLASFLMSGSQYQGGRGGAVSSIGGSSAFPVLVVLGELEEVSAMLWTVRNNVSVSRGGGVGGGGAAGAGTPSTAIARSSFGRSWTVDRFLEIGLSHGGLTEAYMELIERWSGKQPEKVLRLVSSATILLLRWTSTAQNHSGSNVSARSQLVQADRSGRLRDWLDTLDRRRSQVGSSLLTGGQEAVLLLNIITEELHEIRGRVLSLTTL